VIVSGGARVVSASDLPPPQETSSTPPANPDFPGGKPGMKQDK
jgi:hypothetical protein